MTINLSVPSNNDTPDLKPRITVVGVGGAGGNAVDNMIASQLEGVDFVVANTDAQALSQSRADRQVQLGANVTNGLGAGARPEIGSAAAEESLGAVLDEIDGSHMIFIAAGMGGGTGSGAAPVIARATREKGILTVGVVTKPFQFEGGQRMKIADCAIEELSQHVDTLIVIPNQNLFRVATEKTTFADAFAMADHVLYSGVRGVTDLMVMPGLINLDFADIRSVMSEMGKAMMGTGEAEGERRALEASEAAIANPLLDDISMKGAKRVLINITGGKDMTLFEVDEAANRIRAEVDSDAHTIFGSTFDDSMEGRIRVSVVATGMDCDAMARPKPTVIEITDYENDPAALEPPPETDLEVPATVVEIRPSASGEKFEDAPQALDPEVEDQEIAVAESEAHAPAPEEGDSVQTGENADSEAVSGTPPPATPALGATDVFIPPEPAAPSGVEEKAADPFAAAAMANGSRRPGEKEAEEDLPVRRSKGPSLFERVTRTGRAAKPKAESGAPKFGGPAGKVEPTLESAPEAAADRSERAAEIQNRLDGLDPTDRIVNNQVEDDLLDIPAFLRRQAN